jgi:hypothetical protein
MSGSLPDLGIWLGPLLKSLDLPIRDWITGILDNKSTTHLHTCADLHRISRCLNANLDIGY